MTDYKSVQDLIVKAAICDKITTTIRACELIGGYDVLRITFSKGDRHSCANIDLHTSINDREEIILRICKHALYELLHAPYEEIVYDKEN